MSLTPQDIASILTAAGSLIPDDGTPGIYIISQENDDLKEDWMLGSQLARSTFIGSDIKSNTPAVYTAHSSQRFVFCIGEASNLQLFGFDSEWNPIELSGNGELTVHPSSRLSGTLLGNDSVIFFEDTPGHLRAVKVSQDGSWVPFPLGHVSLVHGRPHSARVVDNTLYLVYIHEDGYMHRLTVTVNNDSNTCSDALLPGTSFTDDNVASFLSQTPDDKDVQVIVLTNSQNVVSVDHRGNHTELGKILDRVFVPKKGEENNDKFGNTAQAAVNGSTRGKKK